MLEAGGGSPAYRPIPDPRRALLSLADLVSHRGHRPVVRDNTQPLWESKGRSSENGRRVEPQARRFQILIRLLIKLRPWPFQYFRAVANSHTCCPHRTRFRIPSTARGDAKS